MNSEKQNFMNFLPKHFRPSFRFLFSQIYTDEKFLVHNIRFRFLIRSDHYPQNATLRFNNTYLSFSSSFFVGIKNNFDKVKT